MNPSIYAIQHKLYLYYLYIAAEIKICQISYICWVFSLFSFGQSVLLECSWVTEREPAEALCSCSPSIKRRVVCSEMLFHSAVVSHGWCSVTLLSFQSSLSLLSDLSYDHYINSHLFSIILLGMNYHWASGPCLNIFFTTLLPHDWLIRYLHRGAPCMCTHKTVTERVLDLGT